MSRRTAFLILALPSFLLGMSVCAQPASRVKDIDTRGNSTWPTSLTVAGGRLFFVADDGPHGAELWTSDGTGPGTTRVPGTSGIWTVLAGNEGAFFFKNAGGLGDLWRSDGTEAGTSLVKAGVGLAMESAVAGTLTFFSNSRLWRTDGTPAGTYQLFGNDGQEPVNVQQLAASNGILYFFAAGSSLVDTLWRSDGTAAGTFAVPLSPLSVSLPSYSSLRPMIGPFDTRFFFGAYEAAHGLEMWASDGTDPGTSLFRDLEPGNGPSNPQQFTRSGSRLFFVANTPSVGWRIWSTDGNPANTAAVDSFIGGFRSIAGLTDVAGRLAFQTLGDYGIWTSDGTNPGTVRLTSGNATNLTAVGARVFFTIPLGQLWTSDLTPAGTHLVRSFDNSLPRSLTAFGGLLFFFADDGVYGPQLWKSDGTAGGTSLVAILRPGLTGSSPANFHELNGATYFLAANGIWRSDGTEIGTTPLLTGLTLGSTLTATSRRLFWVEGSGAPPYVLKMSDGTPNGSGPVPLPANIVYVEQPVCTADTAFFFGGPQFGDKLLWAADGTPSGTRSLGIFSGSSAPGTPAGLPVALGNRIVFLVTTSAFAGDLWQSDGTPSGTSRVKVLSTRFDPQCVGLPRGLGRAVVFLADDGSTGCNVWRSDGTSAGTIPVGVVGGGGSALMNPLGSARGALVFANFADVWRTDGTSAGTFLLKSFTAAALPTPPGAGTREGVYFAVQTNGSPDTTQQLWITDGSVAGTILLHDFKAGGADERIVSLATANGRLLATIREAAYPFPTSLWTSDGTAAGTVKVQDDAGAGAEALPFRGVTLFAGTDPWAGTELWSMDGIGFTAPVRPAALSVLTPCRVLDTRLADDFLGGPALSAGAPRVFPVGGVCGVPGTARAIAANVTVTNATADGLLRIHASDVGAPDATSINFKAGQTRANNVMILLDPDGEFTVRFEAPSGAAHVIVDVVGFFE